jgi:hypothetical protein
MPVSFSLPYFKPCKPATLIENYMTVNNWGGGTLGSNYWEHSSSAWTRYTSSITWPFRKTCSYRIEVDYQNLNYGSNTYNDLGLGLFAITQVSGWLVGFKVRDMSAVNPTYGNGWIYHTYPNLSNNERHLYKFTINGKTKAYTIQVDTTTVFTGTITTVRDSTNIILGDSYAQQDGHRIYSMKVFRI